jgi:hypothetical protein
MVMAEYLELAKLKELAKLERAGITKPTYREMAKRR